MVTHKRKRGLIVLKILIAVDGSELALDAGCVTRCVFASRAWPRVFVLANVQEPASLNEMLTVRDPERLQGLSASAGAHCLQGARKPCHAAGVDYEMEIALGEPAHTLLDIAERYGLQRDHRRCARQRRPGRRRSGFGVALELMHVSRLPVTIVKHAEVLEEGEQVSRVEEAPQGAETEPQVVLGLA